MKIELEDLSFRYAQPDMYFQLAEKVSKKKTEREKYIADVKTLLQNELAKKADFTFEVQGRPKHYYSIYKKMQSRNLDYDQIYDVLAFRLLVSSLADCYAALGIVHSIWKPIPGRFKDFIAMPKANNYQSLHTTVVGPGGERIEIQIRTQEMHLIAERGIAAHWKYKEGSVSDELMAQKFNWLRELVSRHQQTPSSDEFLEDIKTDLFESEIYVFTPKGDVKEFPEGATPLDFAFSIHTDVGIHTVAARVNGRLVPLKHKLSSGDTVDILTSPHQVPSKDWLKICVTTRAQSKIRSFIKNEQRKRALELGRELLEKEMRKYGLSPAKVLKERPDLEKVLRSMGANEVDDLYIQVGYGKLVPKAVVEAFSPEVKPVNEEETTFLQKVFKAAADRKKTNSLVVVDGMSDVLVRYAKCCTPIPGDPIVGFITRGRGITVHQADCPRAFEMDQMRKIDVMWNSSKGSTIAERTVRVRVVSLDTPGLLRNMSEVFTARGMNIQNAQIRTTKDKKAVCVFDVSVKDAEQLFSVFQDLQKIKGILGVTRITHS